MVTGFKIHFAIAAIKLMVDELPLMGLKCYCNTTYISKIAF